MKFIFLGLLSAFLFSCDKASADKKAMPNNDVQTLTYTYNYKCEEKAEKIAHAVAAIDDSQIQGPIQNRYTKPAYPNKKGELESMEEFDWQSFKDGECKIASVVLMYNETTGKCNYNNSGTWIDCK